MTSSAQRHRASRCAANMASLCAHSFSTGVVWARTPGRTAQVCRDSYEGRRPEASVWAQPRRRSSTIISLKARPRPSGRVQLMVRFIPKTDVPSAVVKFGDAPRAEIGMPPQTHRSGRRRCSSTDGEFRAESIDRSRPFSEVASVGSPAGGRHRLMLPAVDTPLLAGRALSFRPSSVSVRQTRVLDKRGAHRCANISWGMAWYAIKTYRRDQRAPGGRRLVDVSRFAADEDGPAIVEAHRRTKLLPDTHFVILCNPVEQAIWKMETPRA